MTAGKAISSKDMNGLKVVNVGDPTAAQDVSTKNYTDTQATNAKSRANHTGTQLAATISDFDSQVRTSRLDQMAAPTGSVGLNNQRIINVSDPSSAQDASTKAYVDNQIAGLVSGQILKGSVRAAALTNINIASAPATIDGVTPANGDIFLLTAQTTGSQNGPYVWTAAGAAMTRALNWDTNAEAVLGSYWIVREGSKADNMALMTNDTAINLGTTTPAFIFISVAGASIGRYTVTSPATAAGVGWVINHAMNSRDVHVDIRRTASPYDFVDCYIESTDLNNVTVTADIALAAGEYTAIVKY